MAVLQNGYRRIRSVLIASLVAISMSYQAVSDPASQSPIIIGLDADMSASAAEGGTAIYRGAILAIDEINAQGGVLGRPLKLDVKDHRGNPARGVRNLKQFNTNEDVVAVLSGVHTPVVLQELDFLHQNKMLMLVPWAAGTAIVDNGFSPNFVFRASVRDSEAASVILNEIKRKGIDRVALILERTGWGRSNQTSMSAYAATAGITISHVSWINWRQTAFEDEISQIAQSDAQAVVLVTNAPEGVTALNALLNNQGTHNLPVVSHWGIAGGRFTDLIGLDALSALDLTVLQTFHFSAAKNRELASKVLTQYREKFDPNASTVNIPGKVGLAHAYDLVNMLALAIQDAGSTEQSRVHTSLKSIQKYDGLVKQYINPFTDKQDALWAPDYILTRYDSDGYLVPSVSSEQ